MIIKDKDFSRIIVMGFSFGFIIAGLLIFQAKSKKNVYPKRLT